jgi:hypothetical protein
MRSIDSPDTIKMSAFFFALQMLILTTAELQIRQDGDQTVYDSPFAVPAGRHFINRMRELTDSHAALS